MTRRNRLRRPGSSWRLLVHGYDRDATTGRWVQGPSYDVTSDPDETGREGQPSPIVLEMTEFDELVVGQAIHIEQMDERRWWMSIGGVHLTLTIDRDGRPTSVFSEGAVDPREGCTYDLTGGWE